MSWDTEELKAKGLQVLPSFFPDDVKADLARRAEEVKQGVADGSLQRHNQFATGLEPAWFSMFFQDRRLLDLITGLLGPDLCCTTWRVLMKDAHFNGPISVHQDWAYFGGDTRKLNVFVPLTEVNRGNGAIVFYEQSHQFGPVERGAIDVARYPYLKESCPDLEVGDILVADFLTWHSSVPATSAKERIMLQLVYQPSSDASSKHLVAGEMRNRRNNPNRLEPLKEPQTQVSCMVAREFLAAGDKIRAERYARGVLASEPTSAEAALLIYDLLSARNDPEAAYFLQVARDALDKLNAEMAARLPAAAPVLAETPQASPAARADSLGSRLSRRLARLRQPA